MFGVFFRIKYDDRKGMWKKFVINKRPNRIYGWISVLYFDIRKKEK